MDPLKEKFRIKSTEVREKLRSMVKAHGDMVVDQVVVGQVFGGMRGIKGMIWETSNLDPIEGIKFRGRSIPQLQDTLPRLNGSTEPVPEGLFWLMMVGEVPTEEEAQWLADEWERRRKIPQHTLKVLESLPLDTHPMTQFSMAVMSMQSESIFAREYFEGLSKSDYWAACYEDTMNLIARLPSIAAYIYRRSFQ